MINEGAYGLDEGIKVKLARPPVKISQPQARVETISEYGYLI